MKIKDETVNIIKLNFANPIFVEIEDGDEESIKYYKRMGAAIKRIPIKNGSFHYYAILDGDKELADKVQDSTEIPEKADELNRCFNSMNRAAARTKEKESGKKVGVEVLSYEKLKEDGYDAAKDESDLGETVAYGIMVDALCKAYGELTEEKRRICQAVGSGVADRQAASELGMAKSTYQDRRKKTMKELEKELRGYK